MLPTEARPIVVVDLDPGGIRARADLRPVGRPDARVVVLSEPVDGPLVLEAMRLGVFAFVRKPDGLRELSEVLARVACRRARASRPDLELIGGGASSGGSPGGRRRRPRSQAPITPREREILGVARRRVHHAPDRAPSRRSRRGPSRHTSASSTGSWASRRGSKRSLERRRWDSSTSIVAPLSTAASAADSGRERSCEPRRRTAAQRLRNDEHLARARRPPRRPGAASAWSSSIRCRSSVPASACSSLAADAAPSCSPRPGPRTRRCERSHASAGRTCVVLVGLGLDEPHDASWLIREVRERYPFHAVLAVGANADPTIISRALFVGADGFVDKTCRAGCVRFVDHTGGEREMVLAGPTSTTVGPIADGIERRRDLDALLTRREREVLDGRGGGTDRARDRGSPRRPRAHRHDPSRPHLRQARRRQSAGGGAHGGSVRPRERRRARVTAHARTKSAPSSSLVDLTPIRIVASRTGSRSQSLAATIACTSQRSRTSFHSAPEKPTCP